MSTLRVALWLLRGVVAIASAGIGIRMWSQASGIPLELGGIVVAPLLLFGGLLFFLFALVCLAPIRLDGLTRKAEQTPAEAPDS